MDLADFFQTILFRLLGQPLGRGLLDGLHNGLERNQQHIGRFGPHSSFRWSLSTMGGSADNLQHCMDHLRPRYQLDSSSRCLPLGLPFHRLVRGCWNWSEALPWRSRQVSHWSQWSCGCSLIHGCHFLFRRIVDQLCRGLQREDACQHSPIQNLLGDLRWYL